MEDEDDISLDFVYERVQAIRNIALDLETLRNRHAVDLLRRAGELALQHLTLKSATIVELAAEDGKLVKERPL